MSHLETFCVWALHDYERHAGMIAHAQDTRYDEWKGPLECIVVELTSVQCCMARGLCLMDNHLHWSYALINMCQGPYSKPLQTWRQCGSIPPAISSLVSDNFTIGLIFIIHGSKEAKSPEAKQLRWIWWYFNSFCVKIVSLSSNGGYYIIRIRGYLFHSWVSQTTPWWGILQSRASIVTVQLTAWGDVLDWLIDWKTLLVNENVQRRYGR